MFTHQLSISPSIQGADAFLVIDRKEGIKRPDDFYFILLFSSKIWGNCGYHNFFLFECDSYCEVVSSAEVSVFLRVNVRHACTSSML